MSELSLSELLNRSLAAAHALTTSHPSPSSAGTLEHLSRVLADLTLCERLSAHVGVISANEPVSELSTRALPTLFVPSFTGQLHLLAHTTGSKTRRARLRDAQAHLQSFIDKCDEHEIVAAGSERAALRGTADSTGAGSNPAARREAKIAQFRREKELKAKISELNRVRRRRATSMRSAAGASVAASTSTAPATTPAQEAGDDWPILPPLSSDADGGDDDDDDDDELDEVLRPLLLDLLKLHYLRACAELVSCANELELLQNAIDMSDLPSSSSSSQRDPREAQRVSEEERWKVERVESAWSKDGPLLDQKGKILRPFTILPSEQRSRDAAGALLGTRVRVADEVFGASHNLPTMTIDEYLAEERARGGVVERSASGPGPRTTAEQEQEREERRALDPSEDDTTRGRLLADETGQGGALRKQREDDDFRDSHRRGEGNMYNRG